MHSSGVSVSGEPLLTGDPEGLSSRPILRGDEPPSVVVIDGAEMGGGDPGGGAPSLPCLDSNNCTDSDGQINLLTGGHKRTAFVLTHETQQLATEFGIERLGFLTLTFGDHVTDIGEARRRFHSLCTHVIKVRYRRAIVSVERMKSGRVHFHLVVAGDADIRTGCDFEAVGRGDYRSANAALRAEWAFWRKLWRGRKYGFGRNEILPVRSTAEAVAKYVGKYISKHIGQRRKEDKGARLVSFVGYGPGDRSAGTRFSWAGLKTGGAWLWRQKLGAYCRRVGVEDTDGLRKLFGHRWAYFLRDSIMLEPLPEGTKAPSYLVACKARVAEDKALVARVNCELWRRDNSSSFNRTYLLRRSREVMSSDPVWAVPCWVDNKPEPHARPTLLMEEAVLEWRALEMRLYALRIPPSPYRGEKESYAVRPSSPCRRPSLPLTTCESEGTYRGQDNDFRSLPAQAGAAPIKASGSLENLEFLQDI